MGCRFQVALSFLHYDVFTDDPFAGNQLAVFLDGRGIATERMQAIAHEMNFSESTFILPAESPDTDVRMRIFTPMTELPIAGHPTIGSTFALAHAGVIRSDASRFVFGLGVGPVPVDLEWDGSRLRFAWMTQLNPTFGPPIDARAAVAAAIGLESADLVPGLPIQEVSCGLAFLFVPLRSREIVDRAGSSLAAVRQLRASTGVSRPIFLFAVEPSGTPETVYSRMFAPESGIVEDPATGGASGPLGCYLVRHRLVSPEAARQMVNLQGVAMGRPSRIHVSIEERGGEIVNVKVGGTAVLIGRGEILV
jgi:trans-2,3-dihydro-3-hydroxyanthranilate isomerase